MSRSPQPDAAALALVTDPHHLVLIALDFDGTLAQFQDDPQKSRMLPQAHRALTALTAYPKHIRVALVSGRSLADLHRLAVPPIGTLLIGSHGGEIGRITPAGLDCQEIHLTDDQTSRLEQLGQRMAEIARDRDGVWVEHKPAAVVVHTRLASRSVSEAAETEALNAGADLGSTLLHGKNVVEVSVLAASKGEALSALRTQLSKEQGAVRVLYAGDDVTDETAFRALTPQDVAIKVGPGETAAGFRLQDPPAVAALLGSLVTALDNLELSD